MLQLIRMTYLMAPLGALPISFAPRARRCRRPNTWLMCPKALNAWKFHYLSSATGHTRVQNTYCWEISTPGLLVSSQVNMMHQYGGTHSCVRCQRRKTSEGTTLQYISGAIALRCCLATTYVLLCLHDNNNNSTSYELRATGTLIKRRWIWQYGRIHVETLFLPFPTGF